MEERKESLFKENSNLSAEKKISRKEAIKKTGLAAASATTLMILMRSQKAQASSCVADNGSHGKGKAKGKGKK